MIISNQADLDLQAQMRTAIEDVDDLEAEISALREILTGCLYKANHLLTEALWAIGRLASDEVYDVEFAETSTDTAAFLADAARMVRAAIALNPAPWPAPDPVPDPQTT